MKSSIKTGILNAALVWGIMILTAALMPALAAVPELINFQGKLTDSSDKAVTSVVPMVFKFYTTATGGSPIWTETQAVTPDNEGVYSVMLGEVAPFDISFSTAYWLGVKVGADSEMLPRYRMVSSAYSLYALNSATSAWAGGADWLTITNRSTVTTQGNVFNGPNQLVQVGGDGFLPVLNGSNLTGLPDTVIADGAVTTAKLAANAVTDAKVLLSTAAITSGKFGDERVAIGTQAVSGGIYNLAGKLVQLGVDGFLPGLNGSNLINITKAQVGLDNVSNEAQIGKVIGTTKGDVIVFTGSAIPVRMPVGADGQIIMADSVQASGVKWAAVPSAPVLTVFGRTGAVVAQAGDYTAAQVGAEDADATIVKDGQLDAADFNVTGGNVSIDYVNGQAAGAGMKGFLTSGDWSTFSGKLSPDGVGSSLTGITASQVGAIASSALSTDGTLVNNLNTVIPSEKAVKTYVDTNLGGKETADISIVKEADLTAADFSVALGVVLLNYGSGEAANATTKGFLTAPDWSTFNGKQVVITGGATTIDTENLGVNLALVSDGTGKVGVSAVSSAELGYVGGVTSAIQTQLNAKAIAVAVAVDTDTLKTLIDGKQVVITGGATTIDTENLGVNLALVSDGTGKVGVSAVSSAELGYVGGVTSAIQTQLNAKAIAVAVAVDTDTLKTLIDGKQVVITGGATTIDTENLGVNLALVSDGAGKVGVSAVSSAELGYVGGVTSAIQTQLNGKAVLAATQTFTGGNTFTSTATFTAQNASVPGITISSGLIVSAGNVGIGTIVPTSTLTVVGTFKLVDGSQGLNKVLTSDAGGLASWQPGGGGGGDVYLASTQTFTGQNTFISTVTAKGFVNTSQYVSLGGVTTFAANGSGVVLMTLTAANPIATIGGCSEGTVGQGQIVTFVVATWATNGAVSFTDTPSPPTADNILLLHTTAGIWIPPAAATSLGATMTLLCTTVNSHKVWVEIGRSNATD